MVGATGLAKAVVRGKLGESQKLTGIIELCEA
jgi:hypothetical protein